MRRWVVVDGSIAGRGLAGSGFSILYRIAYRIA